jgi:diguanylate cyclase (GGDEF)-like protein
LFGFWGTQPRDECLRLGANEILEKSLDVSQLGDKLSRALDQATATDRDSRLDTIIGLPNRASLADAYGRETAGAQMAGRQVTVALLDLDDLATINEQHGQAVGDLVLKNVGSRLVAALRDTAVVTRWEDDNFAILFPETDLQTAVAAVTKAQAEVAASPMVEEGDATVSISFSAGVTTVPAEASLGEAIARADGILLRARAQGPSRVLSSEDNAPASKPTLLVAEDDRVAAALVRHRLERAGFEVLHRANGAEALKTALDNTISLFVLDIRMPGMDGIELLKRLRESEQYSRTPILMLTSLGREEDIVRAFKLGASDYLTKPFSPVELLARVQRLLRRGGLTE